MPIRKMGENFIRVVNLRETMSKIFSSPNADSTTITTFDDVKHDWEELIVKMYDDDFYYGYLGKQALSSSILKTILKSPKEYQRYLNKEGDDDTQPLRDGKLFHWRVLEPHKFDDLNIVDIASKNTKAYKEAVAELGMVFTRKEINMAIELADILHNNKEAMELIAEGDYEVPQMQMIEGIPIRGKADILLHDTHIIDLKTTADISTFQWSAKKYGYDLQAYLYLQLFPEAEKFTFLCIDKKTKDVGIFECSEEFLESGKEKLERGLQKYKDFFSVDNSEEVISQFVIRRTI
tara:strand:- start:78 stop:953 length:876 start_codon:yes stop_codon:yes gene_type:complete